MTSDELRPWVERMRRAGKNSSADAVEWAADEIDRLTKRVAELEQLIGPGCGEP